MHYPDHLQKVIEHLKKFPGVGTKSAERFAFQMLTWDKNKLHEMAEVIQTLHDKLKHCSLCGCLNDKDNCTFCTEERKQTGFLCIVATTRDVFAIEKTHEYKGLYHVLGGLISPMEGFNPEKLAIPSLMQRLTDIQEIVIAIDATLEGDATALYLKRELEPYQINTSRLAFGLPMGSSLDYVDEGTLARALTSRERY